jgi:membrane associated rhomboid family serine protease
MTTTPVGMRCPECARDRTRARRLPTSRTGGGRTIAGRTVTEILIAINVIVFLAEVGSGVTLFGGGETGTVEYHGVLFGPFMSHGFHQYWRLLTAGFLHASLIHLGLNMLSLWWVGRVLEPAIGRVNFLAIYLASLLAGSFGALLFQPQVPTLGASTAIFGIFGALIVLAHERGIPIWQSGLLPILLLNFVFTHTYPGISIGGHVGGLVGGLLSGYAVVELAERRDHRGLALLACLCVAVAAVAGALAVAGGTGLTPNGTTI